MKDRFAAVSENGIPFLGKVMASISHEMRNVLATIYENAGLLEDLVALAERGRPLDPLRVRDLAGKVKGQVRRGGDITERMSLLAHSSDEPTAPVNVGKTLELVISLGERIATMRGVKLRAVESGDPVIIRTDPFVLETLIWLCIESALGARLAEKTLTMLPELGGRGARVRFKGIENLHELKGDGSRLLELGAFAEKTGAELTLDEQAGEIVLSMLLDIE
jgi:signal transduction histidine kinase